MAGAGRSSKSTPEFSPQAQKAPEWVPTSPAAVHIGQNFTLAVNGTGSWSECAMV